MDLHCNERVSSGEGSGAPKSSAPRERPIRRALRDPTLLEDRVLENLLKAEERLLPIHSYFDEVQKDVTKQMRRIVADWMLEVCEEQNCQEEVFPLSMIYMDRFLAVCRIGKNQLQLLGTTCLLLASKLREPSSRGLPAEILVYYTDNSITIKDLIQWELLVLSKLKWNMSVVTPQDFLPLLVARLPLRHIVREDIVISHAQTFVALASRDYQFTAYTASTMAAACIAAALLGLGWGHQANVSKTELIEMLHNLTKVEQDYLLNCLEQIEIMVQTAIEERNNSHPNGYAGAAAGNHTTEPNWLPPQSQMVTEKHLEKARTPTDVRDIEF